MFWLHGVSIWPLCLHCSHIYLHVLKEKRKLTDNYVFYENAYHYGPQKRTLRFLFDKRAVSNTNLRIGHI